MYNVTITGDDGRPNFTASEVANGFEICRFPSLDAAIAVMENGTSSDMTVRDLIILKAVKK